MRAFDSDWFGEDDIVSNSLGDLRQSRSSAPTVPASASSDAQNEKYAQSPAIVAIAETSPTHTPPSRSNSTSPQSAAKISGRVLPNAQKAAEPAPHTTKLVVGQTKTKEGDKREEEWIMVQNKRTLLQRLI
jgi:hypothetical protein